MTAQVSPTRIYKSWRNDGTPNAGGTMWTYAAGTTTPQATYTDASQTTQNTNPIVFNARGEANVWLDPTLVYKYVEFQSDGTQIGSTDDIDGVLSQPLNTNLIPAVDNLYTIGNTSFAWAQLYLGANHEPALDTSTGIIGYIPRTNAENTAGITPTNFSYQPGDVRRYGVTGDGITDDTNAINNAFKVGYRGVTIFFQPSMVCVSTNLTLNVGNINIPPVIQWNGATLKAKAATVGSLLIIENPHSAWPKFVCDDAVINANSTCSVGLEIHGSQGATYSRIDCINATNDGLYLHGDASFGVYNNTFIGCRGGYNGNINGRYGIREYGTGPTYYCNANTFINCVAQFNTSDGWNIDYAQNDHFGCDAEQNSGYGCNINHTQGMKWLGGYLENNNGGGSGYAVHIDNTNSGGVIWMPSRINGGANPADTWTTAGMYYAPGQTSTNPVVDVSGNMIVESLKCRTSGIALNNATVSSNTLTFSTGSTGLIAVGGTNYISMTGNVINLRLPTFVQNTAAKLFAGAGSPETVVTGAVGSLYLRTDGGASTTLYVKESGSGNTGWIAK